VVVPPREEPDEDEAPAGEVDGGVGEGEGGCVVWGWEGVVGVAGKCWGWAGAKGWGFNMGGDRKDVDLLADDESSAEEEVVDVV